ncbi:unannotated protein [freshwater metagenome]|uniref:1-(5-phosphoribosyl)-5-[(5-phosphoribosylamino)methylideneamino]imidazole-4-carboxamideisomerase n=1 Tax=freshwater metagenome TaxID=449393 RepID=A0A6J6IZ47_9ZZZZ|nr:bifunctional 1-(5-phosphoribosyl)-5-((5-phosphoribosylamino)methylideneamino)imidazole-4-carboxamide isomerase/phosphoribosylanthranilate isomerase PriA [Actinomycetota bacterium]
MANYLELLPAVDVADGRAVRLTQGKSGSDTHSGSALEAALAWIEAGAEWIHLVDLDAAFERGENRKVIQEVVSACSGIKIQLSGGIIDDTSLKNALDSGATRVVLGTAALENLNWVGSAIEEFGDLLAIGIDVRGKTLAARGSTKEGGELFEVLERLEQAGSSRYVVTDVTKDGALEGPNFELLSQVLARTRKPVVASGGISNLEDISALRELVEKGLEGAILGKALYAKRFTLEQALEIASK